MSRDELRERSPNDRGVRPARLGVRGARPEGRGVRLEANISSRSRPDG